MDSTFLSTLVEQTLTQHLEDWATDVLSRQKTVPDTIRDELNMVTLTLEIAPGGAVRLQTAIKAKHPWNSKLLFAKYRLAPGDLPLLLRPKEDA